MRTLSLLLLSGALMTACVDRDYDLSDLDFDNVAIGDENSEFRIPAQFKSSVFLWVKYLTILM